jgi:hypothetical protein
MMGFLRKLTKSNKDQRQELITAYLDDAMSANEKLRFEEMLKSDAELLAELEMQRNIKAAMADLPRLRAPRSFTLDPALYGKPVAAYGMLYPALRTATVFAMILFIALVSIDLFAPGRSSDSMVASRSEETAAMIAADELAESPEMAAEMEQPQSDGDAVSGQFALPIPAAEEAVEEITELEEPAAKEAEPQAPAEEAAAAQPAEQPAVEESAAQEYAPPQEGDAALLPPAESESEDSIRNLAATRIAEAASGQLISGTPSLSDAIAVGADITATFESDLAFQLNPATATRPASDSLVTREYSQEMVLEASPESEGEAELSAQIVASEETGPETLAYAAESPLDGITPLRIAVIIIGGLLIILGLLTLAARRGWI